MLLDKKPNPVFSLPIFLHQIIYNIYETKDKVFSFMIHYLLHQSCSWYILSICDKNFHLNSCYLVKMKVYGINTKSLIFLWLAPYFFSTTYVDYLSEVQVKLLDVRSVASRYTANVLTVLNTAFGSVTYATVIWLYLLHPKIAIDLKLYSSVSFNVFCTVIDCDNYCKITMTRVKQPMTVKWL